MSRVARSRQVYAYNGCGSTAYSIETVYGGKGDLYTFECSPCFAGDALASLLVLPGSQRPAGNALLALLATPCLPCWQRPACPVGNSLLALLATPCLPCWQRPARLTPECGQFHNI